VPSAMVDITTPDGVADSYFTRPDDRDHPAVLFLIDAYGLRPTIYEMADRIAADGYGVLVPNLFYRAGRAPVLPMPDFSDPDARGRFFQQLRPLLDELTPERIASDSAAYLERLAGPVAITGYCLGGRVGWRMATAHPDRIVALGAFHAGQLVTDAPDSPHRSAADIHAELYFGFADQDQSMTAEQIATLEKALDDAGATYRAEIYEGAAHGYTMADTPAFHEDALEHHYRELHALLERTLGA
ncbi:MAG TPA: dienelactone hydrolase family protein, partial [Thermoleophilaceae bacterium]|nr:dienelactone hydrolase family protein [Thermoleophilaceae bacterium]